MRPKHAATPRQEANKPESIGAALAGATPVWNALQPWEKRKARRMIRNMVQQMPPGVIEAMKSALANP